VAGRIYANFSELCTTLNETARLARAEQGPFDLLIVSLDDHNDEAGAALAEGDVPCDGEVGREFIFGEDSLPVSRLIEPLRDAGRILEVKGCLGMAHCCGSNSAASAMAAGLEESVWIGFGPDILHPSCPIKFAVDDEKGTRRFPVCSLSVVRLSQAVPMAFTLTGSDANSSLRDLLRAMDGLPSADGCPVLCEGENSEYVMRLRLPDIFRGEDLFAGMVSRSRACIRPEEGKSGGASEDESPDLEVSVAESSVGDAIFEKLGIELPFFGWACVSYVGLRGEAKRRAGLVREVFAKRMKITTGDVFLRAYECLVNKLSLASDAALETKVNELIDEVAPMMEVELTV
jgi:hypothetical protein